MPAFGQQTRTLLGQMTNPIAISGTGPSKCFAFNFGSQYSQQWCTYKGISWTAERAMTITEISVTVVESSDDMTGRCGLQLVYDNGGSNFDQVFAGPYYLDLSPRGGLSPWYTGHGYVIRINVDLDIYAGQTLGFTVEDWAPDLSQCAGDPDDIPTIKIHLWGEYTE
jgi:hypothetical protein